MRAYGCASRAAPSEPSMISRGSLSMAVRSCIIQPRIPNKPTVISADSASGKVAVCRRLQDAPTVDVLEFKLGGLEKAGTAVPASCLECPVRGDLRQASYSCSHQMHIGIPRRSMKSGNQGSKPWSRFAHWSRLLIQASSSPTSDPPTRQSGTTIFSYQRLRCEANQRSAAATVSAMSASLCAAETKPASKAEGAK
jgi:hypothetical protein